MPNRRKRILTRKSAQGSLEYLIMLTAVLAASAVVVIFLSGSLGVTGKNFSACKQAASQCSIRMATTVNPNCVECQVACGGSSGADIMSDTPGCGLGCHYCKEGAVMLIGPKDPNLVALWPLDEQGGTTANDISGNDDDGVVSGATWTSTGGSGALSCDGINDYVDIDGIQINTSAGARNSVEFWMYWNGQVIGMPFGWQQEYGLAFVQGCFGFNTDGNTVLGINSADLLHRRAHIAAIFYNGVPSPSTVELYVDGVRQNLFLCSGNTTSSRIVTSAARISGWRAGPGYYFNGTLDEVTVYSRALKTDEIEKHAGH